MKKKILKIILGLAVPLIVLLAAAAIYLFIAKPPAVTPAYGVTWSKTYAEYLGINAQDGLRAALDDLGIKKFRLPVYWTEVEPRAGQFDFSWLSKQLDLIASRGGQAILVVGAKQPRWPECWIPDWAAALSKADRETVQAAYVQKVVDTFKKHPAVFAWQVENEALFAFGTCKEQSKAMTLKEIALVKQTDTHPVFTTESGEWSTWLTFAKQTDAIGISIYRTIYTPYLGLVTYPFPARFYANKAHLFSYWIKKVYVSEFQMEPWVEEGLTSITADEQAKRFSQQEMWDSLQYAKQTGFESVYFWGAEWWYWMKVKGNHPEYWQTVKDFLR